MAKLLDEDDNQSELTDGLRLDMSSELLWPGLQHVKI